jgi:hypothetical protein
MRILVCAIALIGISAGAASARLPSLEGKWRLNVAQSELLPGEPAPAELIMAITLDDGRKFRWTATVKMPDGASGMTSFDGAIDGKPYPVEGRPGSTSAFSWTPEGLLKQVSQSAAGISVEMCNFTGGQGGPPRKMTCSARQTDAAGRAATYVEVFDRV